MADQALRSGQQDVTQEQVSVPEQRTAEPVSRVVRWSAERSSDGQMLVSVWRPVDEAAWSAALAAGRKYTVGATLTVDEVTAALGLSGVDGGTVDPAVLTAAVLDALDRSDWKVTVLARVAARVMERIPRSGDRSRFRAVWRSREEFLACEAAAETLARAGLVAASASRSGVAA